MTENKKILIIDDEKDILDFLKILLETHGYEVTATQDCAEALRLAQTGDFFLAISDIAMPNMDGYEIMEEMVKTAPSVRMIVMTGFGYNPEHTLVRIKESRDCPVLFKPFNKNKVLNAVSQAFQHYHRAPLSRQS